MNRHKFEAEELICIRKLDQITTTDHEVAHGEADMALQGFVKAISPDVDAAYERCWQRTRPWWTA